MTATLVVVAELAQQSCLAFQGRRASSKAVHDSAVCCKREALALQRTQTIEVARLERKRAGRFARAD